MVAKSKTVFGNKFFGGNLRNEFLDMYKYSFIMQR